MASLNLPNRSTEDISIDLDRIDSSSAKIKKDLTRVNESLQRLRKIYSKLAEDSKTKGKLKTVTTKIVNNCKKYENKNKVAKNTMEKQMTKSMLEYQTSIKGFAEVGQAAEQLGTVSTTVDASGK